MQIVPCVSDEAASRVILKAKGEERQDEGKESSKRIGPDAIFSPAMSPTGWRF
jgi:hypothetical protein